MIWNYLTVVGIMTVLAIILYSYDKVAAQDKRFRIPVYVLNMVTAFGGAAGAMFSMLLYIHKKNKMNFRILIYFCFALQIALGIVIAFA